MFFYLFFLYLAHTRAFFSASIGSISVCSDTNLRKYPLFSNKESKSSNSEQIPTMVKSVFNTAKFLANLSDIVEDMVAEGLHPLDEESKKEELKKRPGFAFSLGCHEWKSCG